MSQVCGIYLLFLGSPHALLWWGFHCYPVVRVGFVAAYYSTASLAVLMSLRAKSMLWRALPMAALFFVRLAVTATRFGLNAGSQSATWHYASMEVRHHTLYLCRKCSSLRLCCCEVQNPPSKTPCPSWRKALWNIYLPRCWLTT